MASQSAQSTRSSPPASAPRGQGTGTSKEDSRNMVRFIKRAQKDTVRAQENLNASALGMMKRNKTGFLKALTKFRSVQWIGVSCKPTQRMMKTGCDRQQAKLILESGTQKPNDKKLLITPGKSEEQRETKRNCEIDFF